MLTYDQKSGELIFEGFVIAKGYSGNGEGLNNPAMESVHDIGPIPRGKWRMVRMEAHHEDKGPDVIVLQPEGFDAYGRSSFLVHGDNALMNHTASHGCIIMPRFARNRAWEDPDKTIEVV